MIAIRIAGNVETMDADSYVEVVGDTEAGDTGVRDVIDAYLKIVKEIIKKEVDK